MIKDLELEAICKKFHEMTSGYFYYSHEGFSLDDNRNLGYHVSLVMGNLALTKHFGIEDSNIFHDPKEFEKMMWQTYDEFMERGT